MIEYEHPVFPDNPLPITSVSELIIADQGGNVGLRRVERTFGVPGWDIFSTELNKGASNYREAMQQEMQKAGLTSPLLYVGTLQKVDLHPMSVQFAEARRVFFLSMQEDLTSLETAHQLAGLDLHPLSLREIQIIRNDLRRPFLLEAIQESLAYASGQSREPFSISVPNDSYPGYPEARAYLQQHPWAYSE